MDRATLAAGVVERLEMRSEAPQPAGVHVDGPQPLVVIGKAEALEFRLHMLEAVAVAIEIDEQPTKHADEPKGVRRHLPAHAQLVTRVAALSP